MADVSNVTAGKPNISGAIYYAPLGTTLPASTSDSVSSFTELGYASEDGVTNTNSPDTEVLRAWGGDAVLTVQNSKDDTFQLKLIEALNEDVLKAVYGSTNVSSTTEGFKVEATAEEAEANSWVIDMVMRDNTAKRIVIPNAKVTEVGDIVYADNEAVGYELTLTCMPDEDGVNHYEYFKEAASA
jgi:hypothetical protein